MKEETEKMLVDAIINLGVNMENLRKEMKFQLAKVNAGLGEMRLSYMKLDASFNGLRSEMNGLRSDFNKYAQHNDDRADNHETRITHLEEKSGSSLIAHEPRTEYKKKKKKN